MLHEMLDFVRALLLIDGGSNTQPLHGARKYSRNQIILSQKKGWAVQQENKKKHRLFVKVSAIQGARMRY